MCPEPEVIPERTGAKIKEQVAELERTVKALVQAIKAAEEEWDEPLMPAGTYAGITFNA